MSISMDNIVNSTITNNVITARSEGTQATLPHEITQSSPELGTTIVDSNGM